MPPDSRSIPARNRAGQLCPSYASLASLDL